MRLVVGLGNPGREYEGTRHNVGFEVVDLLAKRHDFAPPRRLGNAEMRRGQIAGEAVVLLKPHTFMNLSGDAVSAAASFFKLEPSDVVVVHDDLDFEPGEVRVKIGGGHGGHNGLRSIIGHLGHDFVRVRLGIGKPPASERGVEHVLGGFDKRSRALMQQAHERAADAVEMVLRQGAQAAMNEFNRREPDEPAPEAE